jgi:hypothetical protein
MILCYNLNDLQEDRYGVNVVRQNRGCRIQFYHQIRANIGIILGEC